MRVKSREVTDEFCARVEPQIPAQPQRAAGKTFVGKAGAGHKPKPARLVFEAIVFVLRDHNCLAT